MHELMDELVDADDLKQARLALIGVFGRASEMQWVGTRARHEQDVRPFDRKVFDRIGRLPICKTAVESYSPRSYMPIAHIVLWREQIYVTEARRAMWTLPMRIVGEPAGGIYFAQEGKSDWDEEWLGGRVPG